MDISCLWRSREAEPINLREKFDPKERLNDRVAVQGLNEIYLEFIYRGQYISIHVDLEIRL